VVQRSLYSRLYDNNEIARKYLSAVLMRFYVECEFTGSAPPFTPA
jgi:hypothetical protein